MNEFFQASDVIHTHTRAQLIEDGDLIDVSETAREAGFMVPVAITRAVWADCVEWTAETDKRKATIQDEAGRLWDVVYMARRAARVRGDQPRRVFELYRVPVQGRGIRPRRVALAMHIGPGDDLSPVITIMCKVPCDHIPVRSWSLFRAREMLHDMNEYRLTRESL